MAAPLSINKSQEIWFDIIRSLPCYFKSVHSFDGVDVVPMHNKAGGWAMKSEYFTVLPGLQTLHSLQHSKLGFYGMIGQAFDGKQRETIMRSLCSDAGTLLYMKHKLGLNPEDFMTDRANPEVVLRLHRILRKQAA